MPTLLLAAVLALALFLPAVAVATDQSGKYKPYVCGDIQGNVSIAPEIDEKTGAFQCSLLEQMPRLTWTFFPQTTFLFEIPPDVLADIFAPAEPPPPCFRGVLKGTITFDEPIRDGAGKKRRYNFNGETYSAQHLNDWAEKLGQETIPAVLFEINQEEDTQESDNVSLTPRLVLTAKTILRLDDASVRALNGYKPWLHRYSVIAFSDVLIPFVPEDQADIIAGKDRDAEQLIVIGGTGRFLGAKGDFYLGCPPDQKQSSQKGCAVFSKKGADLSGRLCMPRL